MPKANHCNYEEAYLMYKEIHNISKVSEHYKKRRSVMKREFIKLGYKYPLNIRKKGYTFKGVSRINLDLKIDYFKIIDSPEKAYFLGLIYADGSVGVRFKGNNRQELSFRISLEKSDMYIINMLAKEINFTEGYFENLKAPFISQNGKTYSSRLQSGISIYRKDFIQNLINQGVVPNKTYMNLHIPEMSNNLIPHFIRGYFDGDGCIGIYKTPHNTYSVHCFITSKTKTILEEFMKFLEDKNVYCYIKYYNDLYKLYVRQPSVLAFWNIIKPEENEPCLIRKKEKFEFYRSFKEKSLNEKLGELLENPEVDNQQPS